MTETTTPVEDAAPETTATEEAITRVASPAEQIAAVEPAAELAKEEAPAATPPAPEATAFDPTVWGTTGDAVGDGVLQMLHESGVDADTAKTLLLDAITANDLSKIDKEALAAKVGKTQATLILAGAENFASRRAAAVQAATEQVHKAAGGKEAWDTALPWIKTLPQEERVVFSDMIDAGGLKAELAVRELIQRYNAVPTNKRIGAVELIGTASAGAPVTGISQREYGDRLSALASRNKATPEALASLRQQRAAGKAAGL